MNEQSLSSDGTTGPSRRRHNPIQREGDEGLYRQSWYAVCRSQDVPRHGVIGRAFFGGKVVVYRDAGGKVHVQSAYCAHVGADLSLGEVTSEGLRCPFHHWTYGGDGRCLKTGIGDPAPPGARLFDFPATEMLGVVWAFNGTQPLFELEHPTRPFDSLLIDVSEPMPLTTDPWVICANTPDWVHFAMVHRFAFPTDGQNESLRFEPFGVRRHFSARLEHGKGPEITFDVCVRGTTQVLIEGISEGKWFGVAAAMGIPMRGSCNFFVVTLVDRSAEPSDHAAIQALQAYISIGKQMLAEDAPIWNSIRFRPGALTRSDAALARYLEDLRAFPRAHPSADYI
jgi:nitrite reductase/ring-hydroxylating ferredoxin subunit